MVIPQSVAIWGVVVRSRTEGGSLRSTSGLQAQRSHHVAVDRPGVGPLGDDVELVDYRCALGPYQLADRIVELVERCPITAGERCRCSVVRAPLRRGRHRLPSASADEQRFARPAPRAPVTQRGAPAAQNVGEHAPTARAPRAQRGRSDPPSGAMEAGTRRRSRSVVGMRPKRRSAEVPPALATYDPGRWSAANPERPASSRASRYAVAPALTKTGRRTCAPMRTFLTSGADSSADRVYTAPRRAAEGADRSAGTGRRASGPVTGQICGVVGQRVS